MAHVSNLLAINCRKKEALANIHILVAVLVAQFMMMVIVEIPMFVMAIFLGAYGRRGFIRLWECVPLFKGTRN